MAAPSLFDVSEAGSVANAVNWLTGTALGTAATALGIVAVATVGLMMLSGRVAIRDGGKVVLGCFILFGAPAIASALRGLAPDNAAPQPRIVADADVVRPRAELPPANFDPYAGASLRDDR